MAVSHHDRHPRMIGGTLEGSKEAEEYKEISKLKEDYATQRTLGLYSK